MKNICDWNNCEKEGIYKAPVERDNSKKFRLLCIDHVREFNKNWNYFSGMSESQICEFIKSDIIWHKPTQSFSSSDNFFKVLWNDVLKDEISMYIDRKWYSLIAYKTRYNSTAESLDPSILSKNILNPILKIVDERTDKNISFLEGTIPLSTLKEKVDSGEYSAAFILKPIPINLIKEVADNNETMPPKSTYVEPKLRSGLTIYPIA
mgnify:CR=1 FL=1